MCSDIWYERRNDLQIPLIKEPILVAAAWTYELRRRGDLLPEAFAARFYARLGDLGLQGPARTAIALNQYGIKAPEWLFAGREAELDQLTSEQIYRLAVPEGIRRGQFFHSRVAKIIYDAIVPETEFRRRAEDIAHGFEAMLGEAESAGIFLAWLDAPKTQSLVPGAMKKEILMAMWSTQHWPSHRPREE